MTTVKDKKGLYIAIIGLDCTDKTYSIFHLLIKDFKMLSEDYNGFKVVTELNDKWNLKYQLKTCIKNQKDNKLSEKCKQYWFKQFKQNKDYISNLLEDDLIVISDRLWTDAYVYQGISFDELQKLDLIIPDYVFWMDKPLEQILKCLKERGKQLEVFETEEYLKEHYKRFKDVHEFLDTLTNFHVISNPKDIYNYITMDKHD